MWANRSGRSPKMSNHERFAQVAHQKWANEWIAVFLSQSLIRSFFAKKWAIRSENRWANSQPCLIEKSYGTMYLNLRKICFLTRSTGLQILLDPIHSYRLEVFMDTTNLDRNYSINILLFFWWRSWCLGSNLLRKNTLIDLLVRLLFWKRFHFVSIKKE